MDNEYTPIEEIQEMVGKIPPRVVRYGNIIILCIMLTIIAICYFIPVKDTVNVRVVLNRKGKGYYAETVVPPTGYGNLRIGQEVQVDLDCFHSAQYGFMYGRVTALDSVLTDGGYRIDIYVSDNQPSFRSSRRLKQTTGTGMIVIQEEKLIGKILGLKIK